MEAKKKEIELKNKKYWVQYYTKFTWVMAFIAGLFHGITVFTLVVVISSLNILGFAKSWSFWLNFLYFCAALIVYNFLTFFYSIFVLNRKYYSKTYVIVLWILSFLTLNISFIFLRIKHFKTKKYSHSLINYYGTYTWALYIGLKYRENDATLFKKYADDITDNRDDNKFWWEMSFNLCYPAKQLEKYLSSEEIEYEYTITEKSKSNSIITFNVPIYVNGKKLVNTKSDRKIKNIVLKFKKILPIKYKLYKNDLKKVNHKWIDRMNKIDEVKDDKSIKFLKYTKEYKEKYRNHRLKPSEWLPIIGYFIYRRRVKSMGTIQKIKNNNIKNAKDLKRWDLDLLRYSATLKWVKTISFFTFSLLYIIFPVIFQYTKRSMLKSYLKASIHFLNNNYINEIYPL